MSTVDMIKDVVRLQALEDARAATLKTVEEMIALTPLGQQREAFRNGLAEAKSALALAKSALRDTVVAEYLARCSPVVEAPSKQPYPGIGIRVTKAAEYDLAEAQAWALENARTLLVLDTKLFEEKNLPGSPIVWHDKVTATIAAAEKLASLYPDADVEAE